MQRDHPDLSLGHRANGAAYASRNQMRRVTDEGTHQILEELGEADHCFLAEHDKQKLERVILNEPFGLDIEESCHPPALLLA